MKWLLARLQKNIVQAMYVAFLCCIFVAPTVWADPAIDKIHQIEAAYLYNILKFVDWPEANIQLPLTLCVYGDNPFGGLLETLENRMVAERNIKISYIKNTPVSTCDVLFVSSKSEAEIKKILKAYDSKGILTVSDSPHFINQGGIVEFVEKDNTIRFNLNITKAKAIGLSINSQLTETALEVR